jgi:uncharacterized protein
MKFYHPDFRMVFNNEPPARSAKCYTADMHIDDCAGVLHPQAVEGLRLLNAGHYFESHEALELAWLEEKGAVRELYRGILQAAVVYLHVTRANYAGAIKVYGRSQKWLTQWPNNCRGIQVGKLRHDLDAVIAEVRSLGPERLSAFDRSLLKPVEYDNDHS